MFLENKYTKKYYQIITKAKNRKIQSYIEKHHVIPKSLGGSNDKNNMVSLTAREHFICHWLLIKMTTGESRYKMLYGLRIMTMNNKQQERYHTRITSRIYEKYKIEFNKVASVLAKNRPPVSEETRKKLRKAFYENTKINSVEAIEKRRQKRMGHEVSESTRNKIRNTLEKTRKIKPVDNSFRRGKPLSEETRKKLSLANIGRKPSAETLSKLRGRKVSEETKAKLRKPKSLETRKKMSLASIKREIQKKERGYSISEETRAKLIIKNNEKRTCPHCNFVSTKSVIARLHMDNCKKKII